MLLMTKRCSLAFIALALVLTSLPGGALDMARTPRTGIEWLTRMRQATNTLSYQGVVAYIKDQQVDSFKLYHRISEGQERERLVSMNSPFREVVRTDGNVARYSADSQQVVVETKPAHQTVLMSLPDDPSVLGRYYQINLRGQEYVAGALTQVVALEPRDGYRYTRLLWVDTETYLPLKLDVLNEAGQSVEQMVFTTINTRDPIASEDLDPSSRTATTITQISHRESMPVDTLQWFLKHVPDGFQIVSYSLLKRPPVSSPVEHILLSDGFSSVSIYIEKKDGQVSRNGTRKIGSINVNTVELGDHAITVMGEVPLKTVQVIADGMQQKQGGPR